MNICNLLALPAFNPKTKQLHVIIETPKGSRNKFNYDPERGLFKLKKVLPAGAVFPFDFGFVPGTLAEDGDPLDVLLMLEEPAFPGCLVNARLLGAIEAKQTKKGKTLRNDRLIAAAEEDGSSCDFKEIRDLKKEMLEQIEHFFVSYNQVEGKKFTPLRRSGPAAARRLVQNAQATYQREQHARH